MKEENTIAVLKRIADGKADIIVDGGTLTVEWLPDNNVLLTGPVATSYTGLLDPRFLNGGGA